MILFNGKRSIGMRILYINPPGDIFHNIGGIETYAREVEAAMPQRGHDVKAISFNPTTVIRDLTLPDYFPRPSCLKRYYLWRTSYYNDYRYHSALYRQTSKTIKAFRPDLVHAFHTYQYGALLASNVPSIVTCHGLEIEDIPPIRGSLARAQGIHCNSSFTKNRVESFLGPQPKIRVHSWGIKTCPVAEPAYEYDLITVGRVVRRKNIDTIMHALVRHPELRYAVVGNGPELPRLKELAGKLELRNIDFLGSVQEDEKQRILIRSRLFIMCPLKDADVEGLGLVYFEAHGAGLPVIGARSGGAPEAIGDAGILVDDPLDVAAIEHAIVSALEPLTYTQLKVAVQLRQTSHSWDHFIDGLESWYLELLA